MTVKTYQAFSMAEALAAVKRDLGRDAVILHTRSFRKGGFFGMGGRQVWEITASRNVNVPARPSRRSPAAGRRAAEAGVTVIDGPAHLPTAATATALAEPAGNLRRTPQTDALTEQVQALTTMVERLVRQNHPASQPAVPEELFETYLALLQQEVAEDVAQEIIEHIRRQLTGEQLRDKALIRATLMEFVASMIPTGLTAEPTTTDRPRVIALIGPTGVGKTTTIAKLAANLKLRERRRVGLITLDTYRIAAVEQLRTYAQIIDVPLEVAQDPAELSAVLERMRDCDVVLIDTAGRSQNDTERLGQLQAFLQAARPDEVHLVLSTTASQRNIQSAVEHFAPLGVDRLILTKLDEAVSFGMVLNVVRKLNAGLSFITTGQDVPDDIEVGQGRRLAELIAGGTV